MPKPWLRAIATEHTLTAKAAAVTISGSARTRVYAYALSGPQYQTCYRFRYSAYAIKYVLALAQDIRPHGVVALGSPPPPGWLLTRPSQSRSWFSGRSSE